MTTINVVPDDKDETNANKRLHFHALSNAGEVVTKRTMTSDRKRKCSNRDDDVSVGCLSQSGVDGDRCVVSKSIRPGRLTVERPPVAVRVSSAITTPTSSPGAAVQRTIWSPPAHHHNSIHGQLQEPDSQPPTAYKGYPDNGDKLYAFPLGVVDVRHKNWNGPDLTRIIIEQTLCRESVLPVLLLSSSSCC